MERKSEGRRKQKAERVRTRFPRKMNPMTSSDVEDRDREIGRVSNGDLEAQRRKVEAIQAKQLLDRERRAKIEKWNAAKDRIESNYPRKDWSVSTYFQRFIDLVAWLGDRPLGGIIQPAAVPWPLFVKPDAISPEDVKEEEIKRFLQMLKESMDHKSFASLLRKLRVRFHPDKWPGDVLDVKNTEEKIRWQKALLNTSQMIAVMYDEL